MTLAEIGGNVVEVGHGVDVQPDIGNRDDDIGAAETEPHRDLGGFIRQVRPAFSRSRSSPVIPRSTPPFAEAAGNLGRRQEGDLDADYAPRCGRGICGRRRAG